MLRLGIRVLFYSEARDRTTDAPLDIELDAANRRFILPLIDEDLIDAVESGGDWRNWFDTVTTLHAQQRNRVILIPVSLSDEAINFCNRRRLPNAIRWHYWATQGDEEKIDRLAVHLIPTLFNALREEAGAQADDDAYKKIDLFLSHAKGDGRDLAIAFVGTSK